MAHSNPTDDRIKQVLLILGMHRSGTSALAGALGLLGAELGPSLIPPDPHINPKGFFENADAVAVNERILASLDSSWHDERALPPNWWESPQMAPMRDEILSILRRDYGKSPLSVVKDPRLCRLLPLWAPILARRFRESKAVLILRDPQEVVESLWQRDRIPHERGYMLWLRHVLEAERWSRAYPRMVVLYEDLLSDWEKAINGIGRRLGVVLPPRDEASHRAVQAFLDPDLRHHAAAEKDKDSRIAALAISVYRELGKESDGWAQGSVLGQAEAELSSVSDALAPWSDEIQMLRRERAVLAEANRTLTQMVTAFQSDIAWMKRTWTWRLTKPFRVISQLTRRRDGPTR